MSIVDVQHVTKTYGDITAVDDVSLTAEPGQILALAGPDGAGKTTLFRTLCGLVEFDTGTLTISGYDVAGRFAEVKPQLGYMPQNFSLYPDLSVEENLKFYAGLFGLSRTDFAAKREPLYRFSGLGPFRGRRAGQLSGGMKQKLALSCALIHDPKVLILDEPTTGVDPLSRRQFWDILKSLRSDGSCIVVSTPYMDEVELADRAIFMHRGRKLAEGIPGEMTRLYSGSVYRLDVEPSSAQMRRLGGIAELDARRFGASIHLYAPTEFSPADVQAQLVGIGLDAADIERIEPELEDVFIQLMGS